MCHGLQPYVPRLKSFGPQIVACVLEHTGGTAAAAAVAAAEAELAPPPPPPPPPLNAQQSHAVALALSGQSF